VRAGESHALDYLARGAAFLHLSVEAPDRVPGWDVIVLTAASESQARLYEFQLEAARRRGLMGDGTRTVVVEDPQGKRIGSGGATLNALRRLAGEFGDGLTSKRVLLVHAGGDSRRVPWANVFGKCFIPFPLFADPDREVPAVLDHQLAVAALFALQMPNGGLLSLAGDVLPLFSAAHVRLPENGGCVVTAPASLDVAGRHGVIVAGSDSRVQQLFQKATPEQLEQGGALLAGGAALLDTGIYAFTGSAYRSLVGVATGDPDPVSELISAGQECSLYEEVAGAFVPSARDAVRRRPLGESLVRGLGGESLFNQTVTDLQFIHFGTSAEVLDHLTRLWGGRLARRILAEGSSSVGASTVVCASRLGERVCVGEGSLIYGCSLDSPVNIGNRCLVMGLDVEGTVWRVPHDRCVWQVPLRHEVVGANGHPNVIVCCGTDDNPKDDALRGTFCNRRIGLWLSQHGIAEDEIWEPTVERTLWSAKLFPEAQTPEGLRLCEWMMGDGQVHPELREKWLQSCRHSLAGLHHQVDVGAFLNQQGHVRSTLVRQTMERVVASGLERNLFALGMQLPAEAPDRERLKQWIVTVPAANRGGVLSVPMSRATQMRADVCRTVGLSVESRRLSQEAFQAVQQEVARYVKSVNPSVVSDLPPGRRERVELPVRFDVAGGWSDTPPYCLERPARVLNMALVLDGMRPVGVEVEVLSQKVWQLELEDAGLHLQVRDGENLMGEAGLRDPFILLRTSLVMAGFGAGRQISQGVRIRTWAHGPRGSGLGTSSILGAALLTALQKITGQPDDVRTVSDLVLVLEQRMTTGGGWQDQIGGLLPGVKCISSCPVMPLQVRMDSVPMLARVTQELEERLVIAYTGLDRLAKNVLQFVVERYLRRDRRALDAVARLVDLADDGRKAVALGDLDLLGAVMGEAWQVHQELDPHCSNIEVDRLFDQIADLTCGAKLAGAGGGGFMGIMAKDVEAAKRIKAILAGMGRGVRVYPWRLAR
jgi:fucokinase